MRELRISQNSWVALLISAIIIIGIGMVGAYVDPQHRVDTANTNTPAPTIVPCEAENTPSTLQDPCTDSTP